jgi:SAM-dependent methyltransferase
MNVDTLNDATRHDGPAAAGKERIMSDQETVRKAVRERYAEAARRVAAGGGGACCGGAAEAGNHAPADADPITRDLYGTDDAAAVPAEALPASLGCGNPTALAELAPGMAVLDLGSGGGIDALLSARRVGPTGIVYGLDMTDEMLTLANENRRKAGVENVTFLKGTIEEVPLPDACVDVVVSNCVINLSTDKARVLREAFRVLRPGGRFAVSDIVLTRELPEDARRSLELWAGCVAGALHESEYRALLAAAGFADISVTPTRTYTEDDATSLAGSCCGGKEGRSGCGDVPGLAGAIMSAFVRARKP